MHTRRKMFALQILFIQYISLFIIQISSVDLISLSDLLHEITLKFSWNFAGDNPGGANYRGHVCNIYGTYAAGAQVRVVPWRTHVARGEDSAQAESDASQVNS